MTGRPKGFTLVELLIVISVIMVLAALLFPVFASALERARRTKCMNNLKQLASAIQMYEDDYAGMVMPVSSTGEAEWGYMSNVPLPACNATLNSGWFVDPAGVRTLSQDDSPGLLLPPWLNRHPEGTAFGFFVVQ